MLLWYKDLFKAIKQDESAQGVFELQLYVTMSKARKQGLPTRIDEPTAEAALKQSLLGGSDSSSGEEKAGSEGQLTREETRTKAVELPEYQVGRPKYSEILDTLVEDMIVLRSSGGVGESATAVDETFRANCAVFTCGPDRMVEALDQEIQKNKKKTGVHIFEFHKETFAF